MQDHPNCTFEELEQTFYKHFQTVTILRKSLHVIEKPIATSWWMGRHLLWMFAETCKLSTSQDYWCFPYHDCQSKFATIL